MIRNDGHRRTLLREELEGKLGEKNVLSYCYAVEEKVVIRSGPKRPQ
jgi:hypothetical protein